MPKTNTKIIYIPNLLEIELNLLYSTKNDYGVVATILNLVPCIRDPPHKNYAFQSDVFGPMEGRGDQRPLTVSLLGGDGDHAHGPARQDIGTLVSLMECSFATPSRPLS